MHALYLRIAPQVNNTHQDDAYYLYLRLHCLQSSTTKNFNDEIIIHDMSSPITCSTVDGALSIRVHPFVRINQSVHTKSGYQYSSIFVTVIIIIINSITSNVGPSGTHTIPQQQ